MRQLGSGAINPKYGHHGNKGMFYIYPSHMSMGAAPCNKKESGNML
jgi:hypothetical protein